MKGQTMEGFKYQLGEIVFVDPAGTGNGDKGLVVGICLAIHGERTYWVSFSDYRATGTTTRGLLMECELRPVELQQG